MDYIAHAKALKKVGISVAPLRTDGSKLPKIKWAVYQTRIMADFEIEKHFKDCGGVAAITGNISNLYVLDFDLKYQHESQNFWKDFMSKVPKELRKKLFVNRTKNNGMHVWMRTTFEDKSRKLTRRASTIPELLTRFDELILTGKNEMEASEQILKSPFEVVIETRSRGSYAVFYHPEYTRLYGTKLQMLTLEEVNLLNEIAYSLDFCYQPPKVYVAKGKEFSTVKQFNEDATPELIVQLLESTGMFSSVGTESNGNIKVLRSGSNAKYSGRVFLQNAVFHIFSQNTMFDTTMKNSFSPFEVYMVTKNLTHEQAVKELTKAS
jgi:hypothetical protein